MNVMASLRHASVLAVYAHPDDELFHGGGMLAHLADRGARVTLACATKGEAGKPHPTVGHVTDLGAHRAEELRRSCALLGLGEPVFLGFHDSARKERVRRDDPLALVNVDMLEIEAAINRVIEDVQPHVIVTFDPHGGYYHPDHLAVHRATTAAFFSSGTLGANAPERLFYSAFTVDDFLEHRKRSEGWGVTAGLDANVFAVAAEMVACEFDARPYMDRMFVAFAAHQSAFGTTKEMLDSPPPEQAKRLHAFRVLMEHEVFTLGAARGVIARWPLTDLFDGVSARGTAD
jgi:N-acetyl-1-D-myo-inositol-2-amino-2-deoxy-alpha-D-glucopyranoside deacetylase